MLNNQKKQTAYLFDLTLFDLTLIALPSPNQNCYNKLILLHNILFINPPVICPSFECGDAFSARVKSDHSPICPKCLEAIGDEQWRRVWKRRRLGTAET